MTRIRWIPFLSLAFALPAAAQQTSRPALSALRSGAANPDCAMNAVTGEACPQDASAVQASTGAAMSYPTTPAIAHQDAPAVPSPSPIKKTLGSWTKGVTDYFSPDEVKAGVGVGAAIGMLLLASTPVGIIGGALIGAALGAIVVGGLIGKIWHAVHKPQSDG